MTNKFKSVLVGSSSKIFSIFITIVSIPIFSRLLSVEEFGQYSVLIAWVNVLTPILGLGLYFSVSRAKTYFEEDFDSYVDYVIKINSLFFIFWFTLYSLELFFFEKYFKNNLGYVILGLCYFITMFSIFTEALRFCYRYKLLAIITIIKSLLIIIIPCAFIIHFHNSESSYERIYGLLLSESIIFFILFYSAIKNKIVSFRTILKYKEKFIKFSFSYSLPLSLAGLSVVVANNIDKLFLVDYLSKLDMGLYGFSNSLGVMIVTFGMSFKQYLDPIIYEQYKKESFIKIKSINHILLFFILYGVISFLCLLDVILNIFAPPEYKESFFIIPWVLIGSILQIYIMTQSTVFLYYKRTVMYFLVSFLTLVTNILLMLLFIPIFKLYGAILANTLSLSFSIILYIYLTSKYRLPHPTKINGSIYLIIFTLLFYCIYFLLLDNIYKRIIFLFFITVLLFMKYKKINNFIITTFKGV